MLKIFNDLRPFFENNYKRIHVRQYSRIQQISPPTASKFLRYYRENNLLKKDSNKGYLQFYSNKDNREFIQLQKIYYLLKFKENGLIDFIKSNYISPVVILFGSFAKAEISENSDIDIAIFTHSTKKLDFRKFENNLKRTIQVFKFKNRKDLEKNKELLNNILNGFVLYGNW